MLLSFQTFRTSPFIYDTSVAENFLSAPFISIAAVLGSLDKKRCSIEGKVVEVNTFSLLSHIYRTSPNNVHFMRHEQNVTIVTLCYKCNLQCAQL